MAHSQAVRRPRPVTVRQVRSDADQLAEAADRLSLTIDGWTDLLNDDEGTFDLLFHNVGFITQQVEQLVNEVNDAATRLQISNVNKRRAVRTQSKTKSSSKKIRA